MKKMTNQQKQEFINSNISVVPTKCIEKFNQLDIDGQYIKIREYVRKQNHKDTPKQRTINEILTSYLKSKNAKLDVVEKLMEKCQKWIDETSNRKTKELDEQIARLIVERDKYNRSPKQPTITIEQPIYKEAV